MPDPAGTYAAFMADLHRQYAPLVRNAGWCLPRDNRTRLYLRGPARHHLARPVRNARQIATCANLDPADLEHWYAAARYWYSRYSAEIDTRSRDAFDALLARQIAHHDLVAGLARQIDSVTATAEPDRTRADLEQLRPAAPPGPELVARSLAPHAPPHPVCCRIARGAAT